MTRQDLHDRAVKALIQSGWTAFSAEVAADVTLDAIDFALPLLEGCDPCVSYIVSTSNLVQHDSLAAFHDPEEDEVWALCWVRV